MDIDTIISAISNIGIGATVVAYFMWRDNKYMNTITTTLTRLTEKIANVEKTIDDLFKITADINTADVDDPTQYNVDINSSFLTNNPINRIISLKRFPLDDLSRKEKKP